MFLGILDHCFLVHFKFAQYTFYSPIHYKYKRINLQDIRMQVYSARNPAG